MRGGKKVRSIPAFKQNSLEPKPHQHDKQWEKSGYMHESHLLSITLTSISHTATSNMDLSWIALVQINWVWDGWDCMVGRALLDLWSARQEELRMNHPYQETTGWVWVIDAGMQVETITRTWYWMDERAVQLLIRQVVAEMGQGVRKW